MKNEKLSTDVVFVILHYMAKETTMKCVSEIRKKVDTTKYKIVIVDNASSNGSGKELKEIYNTEDDVKVIINQENLGFAKGNNIGFQYAKRNLNPQYIILLNNDVYLIEEHLKEKLDSEYKKSRFAVLGPLIISKDGRCDINPVRDKLLSKEEIVNLEKHIKRILLINKYHLFPMCITITKLLNCLKKERKYKNFLEKQYQVQLHGCFMVFSKEYIDKFDGLDDRTFLYMEENILYKHMIENNMTMVYSPDIIVYHEEDVSTDAIVTNQRRKIEFFYSNSLTSCKQLLEVYEYYDKDKG